MGNKDFYFTDFDIELEKQTDGDITKMSDIDAIKNSLTNIINTIKGSRRMLPEFASDIYNYLFEPMDDFTARNIAEKVLEAITYWDDRIEVTSINIHPNYEMRIYEIHLNFNMLGATGTQEIDFILRQS